eukprot:2345195-Rhodomonas_salina.1
MRHDWMNGGLWLPTQQAEWMQEVLVAVTRSQLTDNPAEPMLMQPFEGLHYSLLQELHVQVARSHAGSVGRMGQVEVPTGELARI